MHSPREGLLDGSGTTGSGPEWGTESSWSLGDLSLSQTLPKKGLNPLRWLRFIFWPRTSPESSNKPLRPTAYLDGLRGFAAFLVYIHHHQLWAHPMNLRAAMENSFGWRDQYFFATFYGIRTFFTGGHLAVTTFYVISGYVLTAKPLALLQSGDYLKLGDNLASSFFRRWFRLYMPVIATTFLYVTSWHVFGVWNQVAEPKATIGAEWANWFVELKTFSFLFKEGPLWPSYNGHLWSIPVEMRGSIIVYIFCLALSRSTTKARLLCMILMIIYFLYIVDGFYGALFISGMLQCDLDLLYARSAEGVGYFPGFLRRLERHKTVICYSMLLLATYFASVPSFIDEMKVFRENPGWYYLSYLVPNAMKSPKWFFLFLSSSIIVACSSRIWWMKRFFETRFCQYLGRISFSLYLVHGPILCTLGDRLYNAVGWLTIWDDKPRKILGPWIDAYPLPKVGPLGLEVSFLACQLILLPFTFWLADLTTRLIDEPSVRLASWMYKRTLGAGGGGGANGNGEPSRTEEGVPLMRIA